MDTWDLSIEKHLNEMDGIIMRKRKVDYIHVGDSPSHTNATEEEIDVIDALVVRLDFDDL